MEKLSYVDLPKTFCPQIRNIFGFFAVGNRATGAFLSFTLTHWPAGNTRYGAGFHHLLLRFHHQKRPASAPIITTSASSQLLYRSSILVNFYN
ncbi:hypothetical protein V6N13_136944 [Hibiscus sabdariffa]|uniref:Uncharacterized protein n=1 Tax=Hibiscus sabdariffa TaxID=183260 RepID=A0ABR2DM61_9ROSI